MLKNQLKQGRKDFSDIFQRLKNRDFSGNTGLAIKNSFFQLSSSIVTKIGSIIFTIIIARLLMPELFGLYNLALSTILIFYVFSDLGSNQALIYYVSKKFGEEKYGKAAGYIKTISTIKIILTVISMIALLLFADILSGVYYKKPLFLALMAGGLYIFFSSIQSLLVSIFYSKNNFKTPLIKDIFFQGFRIILIPILIFLLVKKMDIGNSLILFYIILSLSIIYLFSVLFLLFKLKKTLNLKAKTIKLSKKENKGVIKFISGLSLLSLSPIFFGNVDKIILGYFVSTEFIGYYSAAFNIITSLAPLIVFSDILFPIFTRMENKRAEIAFGKTIRLTLILSLLAFFVTFLFADQIIFIVFGTEYMTAAPLLRFSSLLLIFFPLSEVFSNYLISRGNLSKVSRLIIFTLILTAFLTFIIPYLLLSYGFYIATLGIIFAMIVGRLFYLVGLGVIWRKSLNMKKTV